MNSPVIVTTLPLCNCHDIAITTIRSFYDYYHMMLEFRGMTEHQNTQKDKTYHKVCKVGGTKID